MRIGIMSPAFPELSLEEITDFASDNGFSSMEIACWPAGEEKDRKYGGVVHIDVKNLPDERVAEMQEMLKDKGVEITALGYYPNPLHDDESHRKHVIEHLKRVIVAAGKLNVGIVGTLIGRPMEAVSHIWKKNLDVHIREFKKVWPDIVRFAADNNVKIAFEHCPMLWFDTWPCGTNLSYSPSIISRLFDELPDENFGIMFDPSHLVWQQIDYCRFVRDFKDRIFCVHAQDMDLDEEMIYQDGILGAGINIQKRRLPGMGLVDWQKLIRTLYDCGYNYVMNIEHEDANWEGDHELAKQGCLLAKNYLSQFMP